MSHSQGMYRLEKRNVAILVISQVMFMIATITVMTLSGVVGQQLSPDPGLATLPIAMMMLGTVISTLPASLFMKKVGQRRGAEFRRHCHPVVCGVLPGQPAAGAVSGLCHVLSLRGA